MRRVELTIGVLSVVLLFTNMARGQAKPAVDLAEAFANPPEVARAWVYWWWLNGYVTRDGIVRDLDAMKRQGISGALVFHAGEATTPKSVAFMSREWRDLLRFAVVQAAKRDIAITLNVCGGWNAGGPWVTPNDAPRQLVSTVVETSGPKRFREKLPRPAAAKSGKLEDYREVAVLAWKLRDGEGRGSARVCLSMSWGDLSARVTDGELIWDVPPGKWLIARFGAVIPLYAHTKCVGGTGSELEIDPLSAEAMDRHFAATVAAVIEDVKPFVGKTFTHAHIDSGEIGNPDWTLMFREQFQRLRGYDPLPYLAARIGFPKDHHNPRLRPKEKAAPESRLLVDDIEITKRFLEDYDRTIADLYVECYYGRLNRLCRDHGLAGAHSEAAGYQKPAVDALRSMGCNDICMSEFWSRETLLLRNPGQSMIHQLTQQAHLHDGVKNASSAAHVYGRKIVQAEAYTIMRGNTRLNGDHDPFELKDVGDRAFCQVLNRNVLCSFVCQPEQDSQPGYYWPFVGADFNRHLTWWSMSHGWLRYLNRCQYVFQEGRFAADFCYLQGEWAPAFVPAKWAMDPPLPSGTDCDTINVEALVDRAAAGPNGRLILPNGLSYRYLVLWQGGRWLDCSPEPLALSPATMRKLKDLVDDGVTLIGPRPRRAIGLTDYARSDAQVTELSETIWGDSTEKAGARKLGKGRVIWGRSLSDVMLADRIPPDLDIRETSETASLPLETLSGIRHPSTFDWIHYRIGSADAYFIANLRNARAAGEFVFRDVADTDGKPRQSELWDAVTGQIRDLPACRITDDLRIATMLRFEPRQSLFVVFRRPMAPLASGAKSPGRPKMLTTNFPDSQLLQELAGPWTVRFNPKWGGPSSVVFEKLEDWTKRPEEGVKHYSGTATYEKTFDLLVASKTAGRLYLDLGEVNNLAAVRLNGKALGVVWTAPWRIEITSAVQPTGNRLEIEVANLWTNRLLFDATLPPDKRLTTTNVTGFKPDMPLLPSGLLGPVRVMVEP
ncbi:MAG: glycosyl hydrolase [Planctomycetota bacterium]